MQSDEEVKKDLILREIYYSPKTGFRSAKNIFEQAKEQDESITLDDVKKWLKTQETYTKFKTFNNPHFYRSTFVRYLGEQVQMDLIILAKMGNEKFPYLLSAIEILSRFAFVIPLSSKSGDATLEAIKVFLELFRKKFDSKPKLLQFDEGGEFVNINSKKFFEEQNITYFSTETKKKASIVERFNRTIKEKIVKFRDANPGKDWISVLPDLVENYNSQVNSAIKMAPKDVNKHNQFTVWGRLFGHIMPHVKKPKYKIGDKVRVLHFNPRGEFKKIYDKKHPVEINPKTGKPKRNVAIQKKNVAAFSDEVFTIKKIKFGDPTTYKLYDEEHGINIIGTFYEEELSHVL